MRGRLPDPTPSFRRLAWRTFQRALDPLGAPNAIRRRKTTRGADRRSGSDRRTGPRPDGADRRRGDRRSPRATGKQGPLAGVRRRLALAAPGGVVDLAALQSIYDGWVGEGMEACAHEHRRRIFDGAEDLEMYACSICAMPWSSRDPTPPASTAENHGLPQSARLRQAEPLAAPSRRERR
jgi:hypothetical protein